VSIQEQQEPAAYPAPSDALLQVDDLKVHFPITRGIVIQRKVGAVRAVDGVSFHVRERETVGLVGESGCGKSTTGRAIARLLEPTDGRILFDGKDITHMKDDTIRPLRKDIQMVFQDPYASLNPRHTVGGIIGAPFRVQSVKTDRGIKAEVQDLMARVGLNPEHFNRYPHEFSGGQRQRIGVARAVALRPKIIICDEPVSALDVSIQAQVVNLLEDLQNEFGIAYLFIAHDLSVVRHISDRVVVMYLGHVMETTDRDRIYAEPLHPYTHALLSAVPLPDPAQERSRERILLQGDLPSPINPPSGCVFHTRCWRAQERCREEMPLPLQVRPDHIVACHFPVERSELQGSIVGPAPQMEELTADQSQFPHPSLVNKEVAGAAAEVAAPEYKDPEHRYD
jgi:peptide/nickel transport system ATP-binding protein